MIKHSYKIDKLIKHLFKDVNRVYLPTSRRETLKDVKQKLEVLSSQCKELEAGDLATEVPYLTARRIFSGVYGYEG